MAFAHDAATLDWGVYQSFPTNLWIKYDQRKKQTYAYEEVCGGNCRPSHVVVCHRRCERGSLSPRAGRYPYLRSQQADQVCLVRKRFVGVLPLGARVGVRANSFIPNFVA